MLWVLLTVLCSVMVAVAGGFLCFVVLWGLLAVLCIVMVAVAGVALGCEVLRVCGCCRSSRSLCLCSI